MKVEPRRDPQIRMIITKMDYLKMRTVLLKSMIIVIMRPEQTMIIIITITMIIKFYH